MFDVENEAHELQLGRNYKWRLTFFVKKMVTISTTATALTCLYDLGSFYSFYCVVLLSVDIIVNENWFTSDLTIKIKV